jgi:hypothetical protein
MKKINSIFSKIKINRGGHFLGFGMSPEVDWKLILLTFMITSVLVLTACAYYFIRINSGSFSSVSEDEGTPTPSFNISRVRQTTNYYDGKAAQLEIIKTTPENILDPSL